MLPNIFLDQPNQNIKIDLFEKEVLYDFLRFQTEDWRNAAFKMQQYAGCDSNYNYHLKVNDREFVLRRAPSEAESKDLEKEYKILESLKGHYRAMPRTQFYCDDSAIIGAPFYVTRHLTGMIMRKHIPIGVEFEPKDLDEMINAYLLSFTKLHDVDVAKAKLDDLPTISNAEQVDSLQKRWAAVAGDDATALDIVFERLLGSIPEAKQLSLIHNDFKFDNLMYKLNRWHRMVAVMDWELACLGDPMLDFGYALANWFIPEDGEGLHNFGFNPPSIMVHNSRKELAEKYFFKAEKEPVDMNWYWQVGLVRVLVETLEKHQRYVSGELKGKQHKKLAPLAKELLAFVLREDLEF